MELRAGLEAEVFSLQTRKGGGPERLLYPWGAPQGLAWFQNLQIAEGSSKRELRLVAYPKIKEDGEGREGTNDQKQ